MDAMDSGVDSALVDLTGIGLTELDGLVSPALASSLCRVLQEASIPSAEAVAAFNNSF